MGRESGPHDYDMSEIRLIYSFKMHRPNLFFFVCLFVCLFQRLQKKFDSARDRFSTLQSIVDSEIAEGTSQGSKSCTLGLLWLKRSFLHKST